MTTKGFTPSSDNKWLVSYSDFITLLLCLFVVHYAIDKNKANVDESPVQIVDHGVGSSQLTLPSIAEKIEEQLSDPSVQNAVDMILEERRITIRLNAELFFESGKAIIKRAQKPVLRDIAPVIQETGLNLQIEGHTDSMPIATRKFHSNWELSSARSLAMVHYFVRKCQFPYDKISAAAFGPAKPIGNNRTPEGRKKNRRVDLVLTLPTGAKAPAK